MKLVEMQLKGMAAHLSASWDICLNTLLKHEELFSVFCGGHCLSYMSCFFISALSALRARLQHYNIPFHEHAFLNKGEATLEICPSVYTKLNQGTVLIPFRITDHTVINKQSVPCGPSDLSNQADIAFCLWGSPAALNIFFLLRGEFLCLSVGLSHIVVLLSIYSMAFYI